MKRLQWFNPWCNSCIRTKI